MRPWFFQDLEDKSFFIPRGLELHLVAAAHRYEIEIIVIYVWLLWTLNEGGRLSDVLCRWSLLRLGFDGDVVRFIYMCCLRRYRGDAYGVLLAKV
ncbi:hypothetical protein Tco_1395204 [Tanacetum coccineum]